MRARSRLLNRLALFEQELRTLELKLVNREASKQFSYQLIVLQSNWEQFIRDYLLHHGACDRFGVLHPSRKLKNLVLQSDFQSRGKSREPNWAIPNEAISFARRMQLSEQSNIAATLGSTPWLLDELRHHRNFVAHLSEEAAWKLRVHSRMSAEKDLREYAVDYDAGAPRYLNWISRMRTIAHTLPS